MEFRIHLTVSRIQAAISDHFKVFFWNVTDQAFDEIHNRKSLFHICVIFVAIIVERNSISVIEVNSGCGYDGSAKIASNIVSNDFGVTKIRFGIDIESLFMLAVTVGFYFFERRSDLGFQFIEKSRTESITEIVVVKVFYMTPETVIAVTTFREKTVDIRIPFEVPAKRMQDQDIAGSEIFGMVQLEKHAGYDTGDGKKETVQERTILKKEEAEIVINGKNTMAVLNIDELERHTDGAIHSILVAAGGTKATVTAKRDKFEVAAVMAGVHGTAKRRITAA